MTDPQLELLRRAKLLALDVDGTLTDGGLVYGGERESARFDVRDGLALEWLAREGVAIAWITGRSGAYAGLRAAQLGIRELHLGVSDKTAVLAEVQTRLGIAPADTIAMGDDLPDLALARRAALFAAPADARPEVRERAQLVTAAKGGAGAVRELVEELLRARGAWQRLIEHYSRGAPG